ncbi:MAG: DUF4389 domain-containing protein [Chloroflexi bacterium]|nr:DUF4389 domain-containing protein [Chloroflexota bacterium]
MRIQAQLDEPLNQWLWIVKFVLIIPHLVVLFFLAIGAILATVGAFFAVLFTGKYPRGLFDYNVGVLRWGWRVSFYSYSALGTDKYPPFSMKPGGYPADLAVDYPEQLRKGLPLIGWWLLGIPQYAIASAFAGGIGPRFGGVTFVLVFVGVVVLLFTKKYPKDVFKVIVDLNRWTFRVAAYALFMTDKYPPFRFEE